MVTLVIFLIKKNNLNRHIKHENLLSIYENMDYFQIMLFIVTCWKFQKIQQPYIKRYFYVFFGTNIVEILLKLRADASSGSGAVKAFLQGSSSPSPSPSPSPSLFGVPDFFDRNKILSGGDLSHYQVPHCIRVFFYFVWFVFIHHNFRFYFKLCTYCNILDIYLS